MHEFVGKNIHFIFNNLFQKIVLFMRKCGGKNGRARQATDDKMAHALFVLNN